MSGVANLARSFGGGFSAPDPRTLRPPSFSPGSGQNFQQSAQTDSQPQAGSPSVGIEPGLFDLPAPPPPNFGPQAGPNQDPNFPPGFNDAVDPRAPGGPLGGGGGGGFPGGDPRGFFRRTFGQNARTIGGQAPPQAGPFGGGGGGGFGGGQFQGGGGFGGGQQQPQSAPPPSFMEQFRGLAGSGLGNSQLFRNLNRTFEQGTLGQSFNQETGQFEQHPGVNPPDVGLQADPIGSFMQLLQNISEQFNRSSQGGRQQSGFEFIPQQPVNNFNFAGGLPTSNPLSGAGRFGGGGPGSNAFAQRPPGGAASGGGLAQAQSSPPPQVFRGAASPFEETFKADLFNQMLNRSPAQYGQFGQTGFVDPMAAFLAQQRGQSRGMPGTNTRSSGFRDVPFFPERFSPYAGLGLRFA